jgi:thiol-disulfide isomerase/thioredoxin
MVEDYFWWDPYVKVINFFGFTEAFQHIFTAVSFWSFYTLHMAENMMLCCLLPHILLQSINVLWIDQVPCNSSHWSDVLQVYAPWCGHCRDMEHEYNHLAELLRDIPSIVIAKIDGTKNEHSLVEVSYFFQLSHHPSHSCSIR